MYNCSICYVIMFLFINFTVKYLAGNNFMPIFAVLTEIYRPY